LLILFFIFLFLLFLLFYFFIFIFFFLFFSFLFFIFYFFIFSFFYEPRWGGEAAPLGSGGQGAARVVGPTRPEGSTGVGPTPALVGLRPPPPPKN